MRIPRLYTGSDERSYFDEIEIPLEQQDAMGQVSRWISTQACFLRESPATLDSGWHNASRRQFIVVLEGCIEIEIGTGERRIFRRGDLLLVEDVTGQGHVTRSLEEHPVRALFMPVSPAEKLSPSRD